MMYAMMNSEFFVSCFFFIICIVVLNFWLMNLFVAVITNTFSAIRSETKKSAFGAAPYVEYYLHICTFHVTYFYRLMPSHDDQDEVWYTHTPVHSLSNQNTHPGNWAKIVYSHTQWCWVLLALASLALQASRQVDTTSTHELIMYFGELGITFAFDVEIIIRMLAELPDWRVFWMSGRNVLDLGLAIGSSVIQLPIVRNSNVYEWFTILQLARFYRVILEVPRMKPLMVRSDNFFFQII